MDISQHINKDSAAWDVLYSSIANFLTINNINLDNIFFVNSPMFVVFLSELDNAIVQRPASSFSDFINRKVLVEKCKSSKRFLCFYNRDFIAGDTLTSKSLNVMSLRLNWNESNYGDEYDLMKALKSFTKSKSHLPIFLYVDAGFFETLQLTKIIRVATLDGFVV